MKKLLLALALTAGTQIGAWAQGYSFTRSTGTYTNLTSPTVLSTAGWDEEDYDIPIGFNFTIGNLTNDSINVNSYAELALFSATDSKAIIAYNADLMDRGLAGNPSVVSYQLSGSAGSRILKIEYKNAGFYDFIDEDVIPNEFTNFQVWLYEGSNRIEMHYGAVTVTNGLDSFIGTNPGSSHGIVTNFDQTTFDAAGPFLTGTPANPVLSNSVMPIDFTFFYWTWPSITGVPTNGTIYAFTPATTTGVAKGFNNAKISVYPNPVSDVLNISGLTVKGGTTIKVIDALGKTVITENVAATTASVSLANLPKGTYFVEITSAEGRAGKRVVKL